MKLEPLVFRVSSAIREGSVVSDISCTRLQQHLNVFTLVPRFLSPGILYHRHASINEMVGLRAESQENIVIWSSRG